MKFKVGDTLEYKTGGSKVTYLVTGIPDSRHYTLTRVKSGTDIGDLTASVCEDLLKVAFFEIPATKLARRLHPNAEEKDGKLVVKL